MSDQKKDDSVNQAKPLKKHNKARRNLLRSLSAGGAVATTAWVSPVVEHVVLPAHAQTSGICGGLRGYTVLSQDVVGFDQVDDCGR